MAAIILLSKLNRGGCLVITCSVQQIVTGIKETNNAKYNIIATVPLTGWLPMCEVVVYDTRRK